MDVRAVARPCGNHSLDVYKIWHLNLHLHLVIPEMVFVLVFVFFASIRVL